MKIALLVVGVLVLLLGLHWIGQGTGYFPWPHNPVMDGRPTWTYIGIGTGLLGIIFIWFSRRGNSN
jgi:hypothetical protein